jgi:hypothetical protein
VSDFCETAFSFHFSRAGKKRKEILALAEIMSIFLFIFPTAKNKNFKHRPLRHYIFTIFNSSNKTNQPNGIDSPYINII